MIMLQVMSARISVSYAGVFVLLHNVDRQHWKHLALIVHRIDYTEMK